MPAMRTSVAVISLLLLAIPPALSDTRKLLARDFPLGTCDNTLQGRWYIADDRGYVCPREQLDSMSGCCLKGEQFSCQSCSEDDSCCEQYEHCVSCCMAPGNKADETRKVVFRGPDREETGRWTSAFDYCRGKCRTSSVSTVHENAYLASDVHCFSVLGKPLTDEPPTPAIPESTKVAVAEPGDSCTAACERANASCDATALPALSNCNVLRQHFPCEAGCGAHPTLGGLPGYTTPGADKREQPAFCWTQGQLPMEAAEKPDHGCEAANGIIQRLCACKGGAKSFEATTQ